MTTLHTRLQQLCGPQSWLTMDLSAVPPADHAILTASALPPGHSSMICGTAVLLSRAHGIATAPVPGGLALSARMSRHLTDAYQAFTTKPLPSPSYSEQLLPLTGATRRARAIVTDACAAWDLPHLTDPAALIANELVSHTIDHVSTIMTLSTMLRHGYLYVGVRGGDRPDPPSRHADTDLSLRIIHHMTHQWGFLSDGDTVMWAALPAHPKAVRRSRAQSHQHRKC